MSNRSLSEHDEADVRKSVLPTVTSPEHVFTTPVWPGTPSQFPALPSEPETRYDVPVSGPAQLVYRGLPLDEIEDLLPHSAAYRQAGRILFAEPVSATGRPLTPLHSGHVGLLACSGLLNGIFGSNDQRHIAFWQAVKLVERTEEEDEQGIVTVREKERFPNELTVVYSTGQVAVLK